MIKALKALAALADFPGIGPEFKTQRSSQRSGFRMCAVADAGGTCAPGAARASAQLVHKLTP